MSSISDALFIGFGYSLIADVILSSVYLGWSYRRSNQTAGATHAAGTDVKFESVWCMILAVPALLLVLGAVFQDEAEWWFGLLLIAVLALYAVPALALSGRRLPAPACSYPAIVAIGTLPFLLLLGIALGYGFLWLMFFPLIGSRFVVGYMADYKVGLRFLRAVRDFDSRQVPTRAFSRYPSRRQRNSSRIGTRVMNVLGAVAVAVLGTTWIAWFLLMVAYVLIAALWRAAHERATERSALRALVFHSLAGIVLSFPGMILALGGGVEGTSPKVSWMLAAALLACWALALASCARRRVPSSLALAPARRHCGVPGDLRLSSDALGVKRHRARFDDLRGRGRHRLASRERQLRTGCAELRALPSAYPRLLALPAERGLATPSPGPGIGDEMTGL